MPILLLLIILGALVRHYFNIRHAEGQSKNWTLTIVAVLTLTLIFLTAPSSILEEAKTISTSPPPQLKDQKKAPTLTSVVKSAKKTKTSQTEGKATKLFGITGIVELKGLAPKPKIIQLPKKCKNPRDKIVYDDRVLVQKGLLQNAIVWVLKGHEQVRVPPPPKKPFELDQKDCIYKPRVAAVRAGQPVTFINSDSFFHNVKTKTNLNKSFNIAMPKKDSRVTKTFVKEEIVIKAKCSVHPWMRASIAVFKHPFFSMTDKNGSFTIKGLPKGNYTIRSWHEVYGILDQLVSLPQAKGQTLTFSYEKK